MFANTHIVLNIFVCLNMNIVIKTKFKIFSNSLSIIRIIDFFIYFSLFLENPFEVGSLLEGKANFYECLRKLKLFPVVNKMVVTRVRPIDGFSSVAKVKLYSDLMQIHTKWSYR